MIYKILPVFVVYIVFYSCNSPADKKTKPIFPNNSAYTFIKSRGWDYIVDKKNIPSYKSCIHSRIDWPDRNSNDVVCVCSKRLGVVQRAAPAHQPKSGTFFFIGDHIWRRWAR